MSGISCQDDCFQVAVVSGRVFDGIDFVFAVDGNPRWRHLGFLVSGRAGNPAEKAWKRVRRHPLFHAFSALALIQYQCSPAKAALRVARFGKRIYKVRFHGLFHTLPSCFRVALGALSEESQRTTPVWCAGARGGARMDGLHPSEPPLNLPVIWHTAHGTIRGPS